MKYKVGDKVLIKSLDWYNKNKTKHGDIWFDDVVFTGGQSLYCGCELTIRLVTNDRYYVNENDYYWTDDMIECKVEEEIKLKFKVGDKITNGKDTLTILTLTPDRYVAEDNLGECGILYFNSQDGWEIVEEKCNYVRVDNIPDVTQTKTASACSYNGFYGYSDSEGNEISEWNLPEGYQFIDENGNIINATKIVLEKEPDDKLKLESTKKVREYWSEYTRIYIEIYDNEPNECVLTHLYTLEGHRQKGYGKQALIEAESIAKELGCHTAYLKVETNSWMHEWYLRMGYKWYKTVNKEYIWLVKNLTGMEKKKKEYPTTIEECCKILGLEFNPFYTGVKRQVNYKDGLLHNLKCLLIYRDAYWKLYGEEMGLGKPWEPDWDAKDNHFYTIHTFNGKIECSATAHRNAVLIFPTEEMRDAFYENFKEEIEICKELL